MFGIYVNGISQRHLKPFMGETVTALQHVLFPYSICDSYGYGQNEIRMPACRILAEYAEIILPKLPFVFAPL